MSLRLDNPAGSRNFESVTLSSSGMFKKSRLIYGEAKAVPLSKGVLEVSSSS